MADFGRGKRPITDPDRRERQMRADREAVYASLRVFTDEAIRQLVDKGERSVRGSHLAGENVGRRSKGSHSDPTEAGAYAREPRDPVGQYINDALGLLSMAAASMDSAAGRLRLALAAAATDWEAMVKGDDCRACLRNVSRQDKAEDRLRSGYCPACHQAWLRVKAEWNDQHLPDAPDRVVFERERRQRAAELAAKESA